MPSEVLFGVFNAKRKSMRPSLVCCGDDQNANRLAAELIRDAGFAPVDGGSLRKARYAEAFALLVRHIAYEGKGMPRSWRTGLSEFLALGVA